MRGPDIHQFADNPGDVTLFEYAHGTRSIFGLLEKNTEQKTSFDDYMRSRRLVDAPQWFDIYPAATKFANVRKDVDAALLVDIGGGPGQELERFKARYPDVPGRCVLQGEYLLQGPFHSRSIWVTCGPLPSQLVNADFFHLRSTDHSAAA